MMMMVVVVIMMMMAEGTHRLKLGSGKAICSAHVQEFLHYQK
jgi:hypothetical protein